MFYAATEGEKKISIIYDLFIILEITFNKHKEGGQRGARRSMHCSFLNFNAFY